MNLENLGWNTFFQNNFQKYKTKNEAEFNYTYDVGRISVIHKTICKVLTKYGELDGVISAKIRDDLAELTGQRRFRSEEISLTPAVGDWVMITYDPKDKKAIIRGILPRKSKFSRNAAGTVVTQEQVIAANIDTVFLVSAMNHDFNPRRIERYLIAVWDCGANPVIVLNKSDLCDDIDERIAEVESVAFGVPIHAISAIHDEGLAQLDQHFVPGKTCIFLGSSGVGKSTIINKILGDERLKVQEISDAHDKGKHTTTNRELVVLPDGGMVIDTPGLREIQLWKSGDSTHDLFEDIEALATQCRFSDCQHDTEPDCAIKQAIERGELSEKRLENYYKLQRELAYIERKERKKRDRRARVSYKQAEKNKRREQFRFEEYQPID